MKKPANYKEEPMPIREHTWLVPPKLLPTAVLAAIFTIESNRLHATVKALNWEKLKKIASDKEISGRSDFKCTHTVAPTCELPALD